MNNQIIYKIFKIALFITLSRFCFVHTEVDNQNIDKELNKKIETSVENNQIINFEEDKSESFLSIVSPIKSESQLEILQSPLQFISPSIRAFEPAQYSIPQATAPTAPTQQTNGPIRFGGEPLSPIQAPLTFISPSIRAFPYIANLTDEHRKTPFFYELTGYIKNEAFYGESS